MYTIATAGHIDHGKSSLVRALTGIDPDRLPEEKLREMTIELGFAHFRLSTGEEVGIIDVPGHARFIKTMISGVGALDMVMFVVAADDGWMPQSEEHLAILRYLGVERGVIILTKVDMVEEGWRDLVKSDLRDKTRGTFLEGCGIIEFSAVDNRNLDLIKSTVEQALKAVKRDAPHQSARLYVDRVFTIAGTGTVVTGTLREGTLSVGQEVYHHPSGQKSKVKSLESFYSDLDQAFPGIRLAVGLQALEKETVQRGDLIYTLRQLEPASVIGVKLLVEPKQAHLVKHNRGIIFLHGTSEIEGRIILPPEPVVCDDSAVIAVLRLATSVITKIGDRFILRLPTPSVLVGGGIVVDASLESFKRTSLKRWHLLQSASSLTVNDLIRYQLTVKQIVAESELLVQSLIPATAIRETVRQLLESEGIIRCDRFLVLKEIWDGAAENILNAVREFHRVNPHLTAMPLAVLTLQANLPPQLFDFALEHLIALNKLERHDAGVKLKEYAAELTPQQDEERKRILSLLKENAKTPVSRDELLAQSKEARKVYAYLKQRNEIVDLGGTVYLREVFDRFAADVVSYIKRNGRITVAEARDLTDTSRKVILPLLEELDRQKITRRDGDYRTLVE